MGPGGSGSSTSLRWRVLESRIDLPQRLVAAEGGNDRPELGAALGTRQDAPHRAEAAADRLQLAHALARMRLVQPLRRALAQLAEALERGELLVRRHPENLLEG